ncbi:MAG: TlpA disulfide reductase family protein [Clostridia bacterium]|nr:TlpA disulfide reductase family protein [Clostridia bacterium]
MRKLLCCLCVFGLLLAGCSAAPAPEAPDAAEPASEAAEGRGEAAETAETGETAETEAAGAEGYAGVRFTAETVTGETIDESYIQNNRLTMLNFWATWCGPCVSEMPELARLYDAYADKGFGIIGVMVDEDAEGALALIESAGVGYPLAPAAGGLLDMAASYQYVPTTVFIASDGTPVGEMVIGANSYADWAAIVDGLLEELG